MLITLLNDIDAGMYDIQLIVGAVVIIILVEWRLRKWLIRRWLRVN